MAARDQAPSPAAQLREVAERHNRVLLHAWQTAHPVVFEGRNQFIQVLRFGSTSNNGDVEVYLAGIPTCLRPDQVQLATLIDRPEKTPAASESQP